MTPPTLTAPEIDESAAPIRPITVIENVTKARWEQWALGAFIIVPMLAVLAAIPVAWGGWLGWHDVIIGVLFYAISGHGVTVGFHRYFTHGSFKANRALRVALAVAGSLAIEGPVVRWVADHRRHHAYSDREGDPHSPWRYGESFGALCKGLWHAHIGWMFDIEQTSQERFAPDLLADKDLQKVHRMFPWLVVFSLVAPAILGGLVTWSIHGALTSFFWASIIRVGLLHHVTWSINSICHTWGAKPFKSRDRAANVAWLAFLSMGESWHNMHHADPTAARHGVLKGQIDSTARIIWFFEKLGWAHDVRWTSKERLSKLENKPDLESDAAAA